MKKSEIADKLQLLSEELKTEVYDNTEFVYNFLLAFGLPKATITRLKKGDYNLSDKKGEVFHRRKLFFKAITDENPLLVIEEMGKDAKLKKYRPRFLMVTDFKTVYATDTKLKTNKEFEIDHLSEQVDFFLPLTGAEIYRVVTDTKADREAAYQLGKLYDLLVDENPDWIAGGSHHLNVFLARILFCFYADDTGIFDTKNCFTESLANNTQAEGSDTATFLDRLFQVLDTRKEDRKDLPTYLDAFPYVNGGLFKSHIDCPNFSHKTRKLLIDSGELDWSEINPDIFGSMIQAVADPEERTHLGMHYTSVENILKVIKPLFLDELYAAFEKHKDHPRKLEKLLYRLSQIKFFDPACGSGNFLIITYKELRLLEIRIIQQLVAIQKQMTTYYTGIRLAQFYGIEIKDFAHEMAILSLWLAEHQMNQVFKEELDQYAQVRPILPLQQAGNIVVGNAARMNWEEVCPIAEEEEVYVFGNPPYLGARLQNKEQKKDVSTNFSGVKGANNLDYISIWFQKGSEFIKTKKGELGFVSTNSICQGQQVSLLWPNILGNDTYAYQSFKWTNNAKGNAGVTVIIVGLRNTNSSPKYLYEKDIKKKAENINAYLLDAPNVYVIPKSKPISNIPEMSFGSMPNDGGNLILSKTEFNKLKTELPGVESITKRYLGGQDFLSGKSRYCLWIDKDDYQDYESQPDIKKRFEKVYQHRDTSKRKATNKLKEVYYQFGEIRHQETDSILIPATSSERRDYIPIGLFDGNTVISNSAMALYDAEPWLFGVLHSRMHMVWVDAVGGKLKTDYRYSAKICYNTFPFPEISKTQKESLRQYVFDVLRERAKYSEKTMAYLYDPDTMPEGLLQAHQALDEAVERIYRLTPFRSDEERLAYLFKEYEKMVKG